MTIAAGLLCQNGVLLCADTEHTGWAAKSHHAKVDHFEVPNGKVAFALAGASALAWSAIQKCRKELQQNTSSDLIGYIQEILDGEYRRNVLSHPNYTNFDYRLLMAVWTKNGRAQLFSTTATALTQIQDFECIGIGAELAAYLIRPAFAAPSFHDGLTIAAYALACVKDAITQCGGASIYLLIRHDGYVGLLTSDHDGPTKELETYSKTFDFMVRRLLLWMANPQLKDEYFEKNLTEVFAKHVIETRREWSERRKGRIKELANANSDLTPAQVRAVFDDFSMGFEPKPSYPEE